LLKFSGLIQKYEIVHQKAHKLRARKKQNCVKRSTIAALFSFLKFKPEKNRNRKKKKCTIPGSFESE
jgi:hypothetical protein